MAQRYLSRPPRLDSEVADRRRSAARRRAVRRHLQPLFRARKSRCRLGRAGGRRLSRACRRCRRTATSVRSAAAAPSSRSGRSMRRGARWSARSAALAPYVERGMPVIGLEPSCLLDLPRRNAGADQRARRPKRWRSRRCCWRNSSRASRAQAGSICRSARCARRPCCTATAIRRRSTPWARWRACCKLIPELAVETVEFELLRHGRRLRLRRRDHRCLAQDGRAVAAAGGAQGATTIR